MMLEPTVQVALVTGAFGLLLEVLRRQNNKLNEVKADTQAARSQVQNSHATNLRDDLDKVINGLDRVIDGQERHDEALRQQGQEIGGLRRDLAHERVERLSVAERVDKIMLRMQP
ncbi:hypothetical protein ACFWDN_13275 [Micromonospora chalcea]